MRSWVIGLMLAGMLGTAAARQVLHVGPLNVIGAHLFDWRSGGRATVVNDVGRAEGAWAAVGTQRVLTLDAPQTREPFETIDPDCPDVVSVVQDRYTQFGVTVTAGTEARGESVVAAALETVTLSGCNAGRVVPVQTLADPGVATRHLDMALRPSIADLTPGVVLAGPSEDAARTPDQFIVSADVVTFGSGSLSFAATGNVHPTSLVSGWLVLGLPGHQRAYTRFAVDRRTGAETWVDADWAAGQPQRVFEVLMVKPAAGAGFGTVRQASKVWESGLFAGSNNPFFIHLYRDGSGERVAQDVAAGTETRTPLTWAFSGSDIVQTRTLGGGTGTRRWVPLRNGAGVRFVMESETQTLSDGTLVPFIAPRVNFYLDQGPATPPPAR